MLSLFEDGARSAIAPRAVRVAEVGGFLACCAPLYVLTMHGWASVVLYLAAIVSGVLLARGDLPGLAWSPVERRWGLALCAAFAAPLLATAITAMLRRHVHQELFDAPSRFLLAIPVMLFVARSRLRVGLILQWILPLGLLLGLLQLEAAGPDPKWPPDRETTAAVDPLVFGYLSFTFGLMCLVSIVPGEWRDGRRWGVLLRVIGVAIGLWLSVRSGTRSGWAALPIVLGVWLHHHWGRGHKLGTAAIIAAALLAPVALYLFVPEVTARIDLMVAQFRDYWGGGVPQETSVAQRLTFLRIAVDLIAQHPWMGIGEAARFAPPPPLSQFPYATEESLRTAWSSGLHNQLLSNTVRSGVAGLVSTALLLFVPLLVCARGVRFGAAHATRNAMMGLAFSTCMVVTSMTTEIVDLKFMASLYSVMAAVLCGAALRRTDS